VTDSNGIGRDRVSSHIAGLDEILCGGFLRGGIYIVQGTPGTGKTTLANQMCFNHIAAGGRALYVTLLAEYHGRMMQHLGNMSFFDVSKIPDQISYISAFRTLRQDGPKGLLDLLRREIAIRDASILILDGFATAQRTAHDKQGLDEFVQELQGIAIATDCTMFLLTSTRGVQDSPDYTLVDGILELSDHLLHWSAESTLQVIKLRGSAHLRGRHAFTITDDGLVVYPRIEARLARPTRADPGGTEAVSSGMERLDIILGGGLPAASTTMVMGPSGVGKTTLGLHFLSTCSAAAPGLLFGFYETPARINAKVNAVCQPLRQLLDNDTVEVLWQPPTDGLIDAYAERLLEAVCRRGVQRLFIDGLGAFQSVAREPDRMDHFLTALMNELRVQGVTTIYSFEVPDIMGPNIRAPIGDLSSLAENLILMRYIELRSRLHRLISILKVRDSDFDPSMYRFALTEHGLAIEENSESAEALMASFFRQPGGVLPPVRKPATGRGG
jgi:circadian clock protein KaiC